MTFSFVPASDAHDLADDVREVFAELAATLNHEHRAFTGECHPSVDVRETEEALQVVVDVPGVPAAAMRVLFRSDVLLVAGEKAPLPSTEEHAFHLVEREFGRFARAVRLEGSFDLSRATATMHRGALIVTLPKLADRRDQAHRIRISASGAP